MRIEKHPVLGDRPEQRTVTIFVNNQPIQAAEGEPIAAALLAAGIKIMRRTPRFGKARGLFCGIGRCTDCIMTVDGVPNVRTCVTAVKDGMVVTSNLEDAKHAR